MRRRARWACLCGTALISGQLQDPDQNEVLVRLTDRDDQPVDPEGLTAALTVTDLKGWRKTYLMLAAAPEGPDPEPLPWGEVRDVPDTPFRAELFLRKPATGNDPPSSGLSPPVFDHPRLPAPKEEEGRSPVAARPAGPGFRSMLSKEDLPREGELVVHLTLPGDRKAAVRWTLPLWAQEKPIGEGWIRPWDGLAEVDRHLRARKPDLARAAAGRLLRDLMDALKDAERDAKKSEDCLAAARDIQRHADGEEREPALEAVARSRALFRKLAPFADRLDPQPERP